MPTERLLAEIEQSGHASSIIVLHQGSAETGQTPDLIDRGRVARRTPDLDAGAYEVLLEHFQRGASLFQASLRDVADGSGQAPADLRDRQRRPPLLYFPHLRVAYGVLDEAGARALESHEAVKLVSHAPALELIEPIGAGGPVATTLTQSAWGIERMGAPAIWDRCYTGAGIHVAHLDTGADSAHPALFKAVDKNMVFDNNGGEAGSQNPYIDTTKHGTHTAATIAGRKLGNGVSIGMAPDCLLYCGTVLVGGDAVARILAGMEWVVESGVRILNMSVGFNGWDDAYVEIMQTLRDKDILPIIAIGNTGQGSSYSPGNYPQALSVGACDEHDEVPDFSSSAEGAEAVGPRLCAPGVGIQSAAPNESYRTEKGTSMATPHIAGLAALLLDARPQATMNEIEAAILASCENPAGVCSKRIGAGIPNGEKALDEILTAVN